MNKEMNVFSYLFIRLILFAIEYKDQISNFAPLLEKDFFPIFCTTFQTLEIVNS